MKCLYGTVSEKNTVSKLKYGKNIQSQAHHAKVKALGENLAKISNAQLHNENEMSEWNVV